MNLEVIWNGNAHAADRGCLIVAPDVVRAAPPLLAEPRRRIINPKRTMRADERRDAMLDALRRPSTKEALAEQLAMKPATVNTLLHRLIAAGLATWTESQQPWRGRGMGRSPRVYRRAG
jgi:hypothetical protein